MHVPVPWQENRMRFTIHMISPVLKRLPPRISLFAQYSQSAKSLSLVGPPVSSSVPQIVINATL